MILAGNEWIWTAMNLNFETAIWLPCFLRMSRMSCTWDRMGGARTSQDTWLQTLLIAACFKTGTAVLRTIYKLWTWINRCWRIHVKPSKLCIMGLALQRPIYLCSFHPIFVGAFSSFLLKARKIAITIAYCFVTKVLLCSSSFCYGVLLCMDRMMYCTFSSIR